MDMSHERALYTVVTKTDYGVTLWLADSLMSDENYRLYGEYEPGQIVAECAAQEGLGGLATKLVFEQRSEGGLNWCGLAFYGDVLRIQFNEGESTEYTFDELGGLIHPFLEENAYALKLSGDKQDSDKMPAE